LREPLVGGDVGQLQKSGSKHQEKKELPELARLAVLPQEIGAAGGVVAEVLARSPHGPCCAPHDQPVGEQGSGDAGGNENAEERTI